MKKYYLAESLTHANNFKNEKPSKILKKMLTQPSQGY